MQYFITLLGLIFSKAIRILNKKKRRIKLKIFVISHNKSTLIFRVVINKYFKKISRHINCYSAITK